jgi:raffinose/stachyose/melibiose transport system permease protein
MDKTRIKLYPYKFIMPAFLIYFSLFLLPMIMSFFFSLTWWTLSDWKFIGLDNYKEFFSEQSLNIGFKNTIIYAILTCILKVVLGIVIATILTSNIKTKNFLRALIFSPAILSTVAVGAAFSSMMHPTLGVINKILSIFGIAGPDWLGNTKIALFSVIFVDVWKGVGMATVIFIAGIMSIPKQYYEAIMVDGGNFIDKFKNITLPLSRPAMNTVIILSFIGGLRTFDLIWVMTGGGPGFSTDVLASIIYKQYASGFYGLSTAGNVIMLILIALVSFPLFKFLTRSEVEL